MDGGSLPEFMLYQAVRYCSMGPDSGFLREELGAGKKIWEWHALGSLLSSGLASIMPRASLDSGEVPALMIHRMEKKTQLLGASVLHFSKI